MDFPILTHLFNGLLNTPPYPLGQIDEITTGSIRYDYGFKRIQLFLKTLHIDSQDENH